MYLPNTAEFIALLLFYCLHPISSWVPDVPPDLPPKHDVIISKFIGNKTDYFKILAHDEDSLLVGARDVLYNISLNGLREINRLEWHSSDADRQLCAIKGKQETDCHNYIRVFARIAADKIMLCGTNSYKPQCRHYIIKSNFDSENQKLKQYFENVEDMLAQGICQFSPSHNSTYIYTDGKLYSATVADFSGSEALIYREALRTEQYDLTQLNQPDFVGAIERGGYVMFFFREIAMEYMNCGKAIYSRVGRVCKNDRGGPYTLSKSWSSFLKTRLNCSMPGEYPFYFDEIQAISGVVEKGASAVVYAVFTTSVNAIPGSAICAFNVDSILTAFKGRFKVQKDRQSNWLPAESDQVPESVECVADSRMLSSTHVNFIKNHPLMETAVPAIYNRPLLTKVNLHHRLTAIIVDRQVKDLSGNSYEVIYVGTDDGKITKFFNIIELKNQTGVESTLKTVVISELQVLPKNVAVRELFVAKKFNTLVIVSDGSIVAVPLYHCSIIYECQECLSLQDPNCAWDLKNHECKKLGDQMDTKAYLQSLNSTKKAAASLCPKPITRINPHTNINKIDVTIDSTSKAITQGTGNVITIDHNMHLPNDNVQHSVTDSYEDNSLYGAKESIDISDKNGGKLNLFNNIVDVAEYDYGGGHNILNDFKDNNQIGITLKNDIGRLSNDHLHINESRLQLAGRSLYWGFSVMVLALVFIIGVFVGLYISRRMCKTTAFNANHRNQLSTTGPFPINHHHNHTNNGKDVNLLVNTNFFVKEKKANMDIGEKDRSHECKNSTENLEKEIPCKTSTLTKVKRTYI